jgi:hypothetical protein
LQQYKTGTYARQTARAQQPAQVVAGDIRMQSITERIPCSQQLIHAVIDFKR